MQENYHKIRKIVVDFWKNWENVVNHSIQYSWSFIYWFKITIWLQSSNTGMPAEAFHTL